MIWFCIVRLKISFSNQFFNNLTRFIRSYQGSDYPLLTRLPSPEPLSTFAKKIRAEDLFLGPQFWTERKQKPLFLDLSEIISLEFFRITFSSDLAMWERMAIRLNFWRHKLTYKFICFSSDPMPSIKLYSLPKKVERAIHPTLYSSEHHNSDKLVNFICLNLIRISMVQSEEGEKRKHSDRWHSDCCRFIRSHCWCY